jgi:hypothetical protein
MRLRRDNAKEQTLALSRDVPTWLADAKGFQAAADSFSPSMRQHLDVNAL